MKRLGAILFQIGAYGLFCALVYYWSVNPGYHYLQPHEAEIRVAFKHAAQLKEPCRQRTREELARLPPNMRSAKECSRERSPVIVKLLLDGTFLTRKTFPPPGLHGDGSAFIYAKFSVPAGAHHLEIRMDDSLRQPGFEVSEARTLTLDPGQLLVIAHDVERQGFVFH
ncbi:MAG: hypothetical protein HQL82_00255 [Magnetococcales bacterium]|nr:hypothetical protein [Magnetococcales bacterium]